MVSLCTHKDTKRTINYSRNECSLHPPKLLVVIILKIGDQEAHMYSSVIRVFCVIWGNFVIDFVCQTIQRKYKKLKRRIWLPKWGEPLKAINVEKEQFINSMQVKSRLASQLSASVTALHLHTNILLCKPYSYSVLRRGCLGRSRDRTADIWREFWIDVGRKNHTFW